MVTRKTTKRAPLVLCAAIALSLCATAQAAFVQVLPGGQVGGDTLVQAGVAAGPSASWSASVTDNSGAAVTTGSGQLAETRAPFAGGSARYEWSRSATLDTQAQQAVFNIGGRSWLSLSGTGDVTEIFEASTIALFGAVRIGSSGEAVGTPVLVNVAATASFLVQSTLPDLDNDGTYDLVITQGLTELARFTSGTHGDAYSVQFVSTVGSEFEVQLIHNTAFTRLGSPFSAPASGLGLLTEDALIGSIAVSAVPEPGAWALLLAGGAGLLMLCRRR